MAGSQDTLHNDPKAEKAGRSSLNEEAVVRHAELPAGARLDKDGVPTYLGLTGHRLVWAITIASSFGFGLFGEPARRPRRVRRKGPS